MKIKWMTILFLFLSLWLINTGEAKAEKDSGLSIDLYTPTGSDQTYLLGDDKVTLIMEIQNSSPWKIATRRLFSQSAFHSSIIVTGPNGEKYIPEKGVLDDDVDDEMPPPVFWSDGKTTREVIPAELLEKGWAKSVTIDDLRVLFPIMYELPGPYTIEVHQPFVRFTWTTELESQGLMGVVDDRNWTGSVASNNKIKVFIRPLEGAKFSIRVEDLSTGNAVPVSMRPVRVFKGNRIDLADTWKRGRSVMDGTTDLNGWAVWRQGDPCLPLDALEPYLVVAFHMNTYESVTIGQSDGGWAEACGGRITKKIYFGELDEKYVIYADNSIDIGNNTIVHGGNIGAPYESEGPWLSGKVEVDVDNNVVLEGDVKIIGDSVSITASASVNDVYYNELLDAGATINGLLCSPIDNPAQGGCKPGETWDLLGQLLPAIDIDKNEKVSVDSETPVTLPRTSDKDREYGDIVLQSGATLRLSGGIYQFKNLFMGSNSQVLCDDATEIRIFERLYPGSKSFIGGSGGISASNVVIYVAGQNGKKGFLNSVPEAAVIGEGSIVKANLYAPKGTFRTREGCDLTGSFIAQDVAIGQKNNVYLDSYFQP
jgi:hypothetical protein